MKRNVLLIALFLTSICGFGQKLLNVKEARFIYKPDSALISNVGQIRWDASTGKWRFGDGSAWVSFRNEADGLGGVTDGDKGDITVSSSGTVWTIDNTIVTTVAANVYTPTFGGTTNLDSTPNATASTAKYTRVGNFVTVFLYANVDATVVGGYSFTISLPVASNFTSATQLLGFGGDATVDGVEIVSNSVGDNASVSGTTTTTANHSIYMSFMYQVL